MNQKVYKYLMRICYLSVDRVAFILGILSFLYAYHASINSNGIALHIYLTGYSLFTFLVWGGFYLMIKYIGYIVKKKIIDQLNYIFIYDRRIVD